MKVEIEFKRDSDKHTYTINILGYNESDRDEVEAIKQIDFALVNWLHEVEENKTDAMPFE